MLKRWLVPCGVVALLANCDATVDAVPAPPDGGMPTPDGGAIDGATNTDSAPPDAPVTTDAATDADAGPTKPAGYIDRLEIKSRTDAFAGTSFGTVGVYETIVAVAHGKLDPTAAANAGVVDLDKAPLTNGYASYKTDVVILRPKDASKARRVVFYDVVNRGNKNTLRFNNGTGDLTTAAGAGDGLFMREGYTLVWSGWQGDIALSGDGSRIGTEFPVAKNADGSSITGMSRDEFVFDNTTDPITAKLSYPAADTDPTHATLRVKNTQTDAWTTLTSFTFTDANNISIDRPADKEAGAIYELIYTAKDPIVMGVGFAALRDLMSFLRHDAADAQGTANPLVDLKTSPCEIKVNNACPQNPTTNFDVAILEGISQSGRMTRDFLWQGFNADEKGRKVFDGAMPLIAGSRKTWTNFRFAQPGRWSKQHEDHFQIGDQFPFTYATTTDPVSGKSDGILAKCSANDTCPKVMHIDGGGEYWQARASLVVLDGNGQPTTLPSNVRAYYMAGTPHGYTGAGYVTTLPTAPAACSYPNNIVNANFVPRMATLALVEWIARGTEPPATKYPLDMTTLVDPAPANAGFPDLTNAGLSYTGTYNFLFVTDYAQVPPVVDTNKAYKVYVPKANSDGMDIGGLRSPDLSVPLGTSLSWNRRKANYGEGDACAGSGSFIVFPATQAARTGSGDPRLSIEERYTNKADYVGKVTAAAQALKDDGYMLAEDVAWWTARAQSVTVVP